MAATERLRLFVSLQPPESWQASLRRLQSALRQSGDEVRWTAPEQIHLTLVFLGNVPASEAPSLCEAVRAVCAGFAPFALEAGDPGQFPARGRPRILWLGLRAADDTLARLQARVAEATAGWVEAKANDRFHPHLTLGRCRPGAGDGTPRFPARAEAAGTVEFESWEVSEVNLMRSRLQPDGAVHERVAGFQLRRI